MHHFIFPSKDSWISSGSNHKTGESYRDQNFGKDQILELKKEFFNLSFDYPTRVLLKFNLNETGNSISKSIADGDITNPNFYLRMYESEGNQELSLDYKLAALPLSQSWDEGVGKFGDNPKTTNGVSWENRNNYPNTTEVSWSNAPIGQMTSSHGGNFLNLSGSIQSFDDESPDINMDITDMTRGWLSGSTQHGGIDNHGVILKFSGSQETNNTTFGKLNFFSKNTHTIYAPKLEVRWDDSSFSTGSLNQLTMSGVDNILFAKRLRDEYKTSEKVKFRVGARKRYIQKTFTDSVQTISGSYVPEGSGSYSIVDVATGETVVPFEDNNSVSYTKLSCDSNGNYFTQWLSSFEPNRVYKILLKLKMDDGQELIFDDDYEFKVKD